MVPSRWKDIQASFDQLVELDSGERAARLAVLASSDPEVHRAVEALLAADANVTGDLAPLDAAFMQQPPAQDPLGLSGQTVSHFEVLEVLGAGGMGVVYHAEDKRLGRHVALKFLAPAYNLDAGAKARFAREARSAAALDHPNLCTIYEVGSDDGRLFLAMPLYRGETLKARVAREGPLPVRDALLISRQIVQGLACAHANGIVHRDLKPGNVMLLFDGSVKVLDFGLAKARDQSITEAGVLVGTVSYMAPEQIRGETVDGRADLWALGLILYEMLTGRKPFTGEQDVTVAHSILHDEPVPPSAFRNEVPAFVVNLVLTLLRKDPAGRYQSGEELLSDLAFVGSVEPPATRSRTLRWLRARYLLPGKVRQLSAAALFVLVAIGFAAIVSQSRAALRSDSARPVSRYSLALPQGEGMVDAGFWHVLLASAVPSRHRIAISPDGEELLYVGSAEVNHRLWLRKRDQLHATLLSGTEDAINPFFSPDGSGVGFVDALPPRAVKIGSVHGGEPSTLTDSLVDFGGSAWSCGYIYFDGRLEGDGIARIRDTGGLPEPVTVTDSANGEWWHSQPEPLPNCKGVLFVAWRGNHASEGTIGVVDLRSHDRHALVRGFSPRYAASGHLLYVTAAGTLMAVPFDQEKLTLAGQPVALTEGLGFGRAVYDLAVSASGTLVYTAAPSHSAPSELVWIDRNGKVSPVDSSWRDVFTSVALSPDGNEIAVGVQDAGNSQIWVRRPNRAPAKLTVSGDFNDRPTWAADGQSVLFVSGDGLKWDLYQMPVDGSAPPRLLLDRVDYFVDPEYSRDGKWLLYEKKYQLFATQTDRGTGGTRLVSIPSGQWAPRLSPNGRWLAYFSDEDASRNSTGRDEVYVRPFPNTSSAKWQVSAGGGFEPRWSRDGRELYYKNFRGQLIAATVLPGATFAVGKQRVLFSTEGYLSNNGFRTYDVSPDGRFLMIRLTKPGPDELIWVENFFEELKVKVKPGPLKPRPAF